MTHNKADHVDDDEVRRMSLDEYKETLSYLRHDNQQAWTIIGLSNTAALALWTFALRDASLWEPSALLITLFGVLALVLGRLMARRISAYTKSRKKRAEELEAKLGFELMSKMRDRMPDTRVPGVNYTLDVVAAAAVVGWIGYLIAFLVR